MQGGETRRRWLARARQLSLAGLMGLVLLGTSALSLRPAIAQSSRASSAPEILDLRAADPERLVIGSVGDILLGEAAERVIAQRGYAYLFEGVRSSLKGADALIGNLEAPITDSTVVAVAGKPASYRMHPKVAPALAREGFDLLVLANNHSLDYGEVGLLQTKELLTAAGIAAIGAGTTEAEARRGVVLRFADGPRIGVLAYFKPNPHYLRWGWYARDSRSGTALAEISALRADVGRLRRASDAVIVQFHFGFNYRPVTGNQELLAHAAIDAGADAVLGHHPHIAQPVEIYRGRPILYSLGNFVFGTEGRFAESGQPGLGLAARLVFSPKANLEMIEIIGLRVDNRQVAFQPRLLRATEAEAELLPILNQRGADFSVEDGRAVLRLGCPSAEDVTAPSGSGESHD